MTCIERYMSTLRRNLIPGSIKPVTKPCYIARPEWQQRWCRQPSGEAGGRTAQLPHDSGMASAHALPTCLKIWRCRASASETICGSGICGCLFQWEHYIHLTGKKDNSQIATGICLDKPWPDCSCQPNVSTCLVRASPGPETFWKKGQSQSFRYLHNRKDLWEDNTGFC